MGMVLLGWRLLALLRDTMVIVLEHDYWIDATPG